MELDAFTCSWPVVPYRWMPLLVVIPLLVGWVSRLPAAGHGSAAALLPLPLANVLQALCLSGILLSSEAAGKLPTQQQAHSLAEELAVCTDAGLLASALLLAPVIARAARGRQASLLRGALGVPAIVLGAVALLIQLVVLALSPKFMLIPVNASDAYAGLGAAGVILGLFLTASAVRAPDASAREA